MVVVAGGELFTGNALIVLPWLEGAVSINALLRNWSIVYLGNFVGALVIAGFVVLSGVLEGPALSAMAAQMAEMKPLLSMSEALFPGAL